MVPMWKSCSNGVQIWQGNTEFDSQSMRTFAQSNALKNWFINQIMQKKSIIKKHSLGIQLDQSIEPLSRMVSESSQKELVTSQRVTACYVIIMTIAQSCIRCRAKQKVERQTGSSLSLQRYLRCSRMGMYRTWLKSVPEALHTCWWSSCLKWVTIIIHMHHGVNTDEYSWFFFWGYLDCSKDMMRPRQAGVWQHPQHFWWQRWSRGSHYSLSVKSIQYGHFLHLWPLCHEEWPSQQNSCQRPYLVKIEDDFPVSGFNSFQSCDSIRQGSGVHSSVSRKEVHFCDHHSTGLLSIDPSAKAEAKLVLTAE